MQDEGSTRKKVRCCDYPNMNGKLQKMWTVESQDVDKPGLLLFLMETICGVSQNQVGLRDYKMSNKH